MNIPPAAKRKKWASRGFTLVELAVVNISIVSLVGLLMPSLGEARKLARNAVSIANLNTLNQIHMTYAAENNGSFYNPWNENWRPGGLGSQQPYDLPGPNGGYWRFSGSSKRWTTESWGLYWYSTAASSLVNDPGAYASSVQFSPSDAKMIQSVRNLQMNTLNFGPGEYIWQGSYVLSPTIWMRPDRYFVGGAGSSSDRADFSNSPITLRRNRVSDVVHPANKVVLFERFDFKQNTRVAVNTLNGTVLGTFKMPPAWCNPASKPNVALADGSVRFVDMGLLTTQVGPEGRASNPTLAAELLPCGLFLPARRDIWSDPADDASLDLEWGSTSGSDLSSSGTYRNFFWATRNGVSGRDFN